MTEVAELYKGELGPHIEWDAQDMGALMHILSREDFTSLDDVKASPELMNIVANSWNAA